MLTIGQTPNAYALITGNELFPSIKGKVELYDVYGGTLLKIEVYGLNMGTEKKNQRFLGMHIHDGDVHYNPQNQTHPGHAGDLPSILSQDGEAWMMIYSKRFYPEEVVGKRIVLHEQADDFRSQPSGNAGEIIAFGEIVAWDREIR